MKNKKPRLCGKKFNSLKELEESFVDQQLCLSPEEKLSVVQYLREQYWKIKGIKPQRIDKTITFKSTMKEINKHEI